MNTGFNNSLFKPGNKVSVYMKSNSKIKILTANKFNFVGGEILFNIKNNSKEKFIIDCGNSVQVEIAGTLLK